MRPWSLRDARARLAQLLPGEARAANLFYGSMHAIEFELCGQRLRLSFEPVGLEGSAHWSFDARHGAMGCAVELDGLSALLPGIDRMAPTTPTDVRNAIATQLAASAWAALGLPWPEPELRARTTPHEPGGVHATRVGVRLDNLQSGARNRGRLCFETPAEARACASAFARLAGAPRIATIPVELRFSVGAAHLTWAELRGLELGDVVLHARVPSSGGRWRAVVLAGKGRTEVATGHMKGDSIVTDRVQVNGAPARARNERPELLDAVSVEVGFEIGRSTLPLNELLRLSPGYVFELGSQPEGEIVDLTVNGASIGVGQLVLVGDALGVRIVRLQRDGGAVDPASASAAAEAISEG